MMDSVANTTGRNALSRGPAMTMATSRANESAATGVEPLLSVRNIEVAYDEVILVLRGLSLEVPRGSVVALLGAIGAGKSTTLKAISGLLKTENRSR